MIPATCHPDRPHDSHGLCKACNVKRLDKLLTPEQRKAKNARRNATPAAVARKLRWNARQPEGSIIGRHRRLRYNLTDQQFTQMRERQGNKCKICLRDFPEGTRHVHIDHNHKTNQVRALLCAQCNSALGMLRESDFNLSRAIAYLKWSHSIPFDSGYAETRFADLPIPTSRPVPSAV